MRAKLILIISIFALLVSANLWRSDATYTYPITTKGDLYTFSTAPARLGVGTNNQVLAADSAQATGLKWVSMSSGMAVTSINADTTSAQVISGADDISVATSSGTTTIRRTAAASDGAYFMLPADASMITAGTASGVGSNNEVRVYRFYLPTRITINTVHFRVSSACVACSCSAALFDGAGSLTAIDSGAKDCTSTGIKSTTLGSAQTVSPGWYYLAWTSSVAASFGLSAAQSAGSTVIDLMNTTTVQIGTAANASGGGGAGVMPSTLGTVTAANTFTIPFVKIQN